MPEQANVISGNPIQSSWGNAIRDRTVQRYASAAARTAGHPTPTEGDLSYLQDVNLVYVYNGSAWVPLGGTGAGGGGVVLPGSGAISGTTTTSYVAKGTVSLTIPTYWGSWACFCSATWTANAPVTGTYDARMNIDGTAQTAVNLPVTGDVDGYALIGFRTGMTTTGARTVTIEMKHNGSSATSPLTGSLLYAQAVQLT
jgi:hypothetical protein